MTCLWLGATAFADEPVDPFEESDDSALFAMEEALVTVASRYAQTTREAPAIVTVITAEQIRARGYRTLAELLRGLPGITVTRSKEGRTLAWFRGALAPDNSKFLLLVDGVPWYDGVYQHAWIDASHTPKPPIVEGTATENPDVTKNRRMPVSSGMSSDMPIKMHHAASP